MTQDFAEEGNGLTMALANELKRMIELTGGTPDESEVHSGCGLALWNKKHHQRQAQAQQVYLSAAVYLSAYHDGPCVHVLLPLSG